METWTKDDDAAVVSAVYKVLQDGYEYHCRNGNESTAEQLLEINFESLKRDVEPGLEEGLHERYCQRAKTAMMIYLSESRGCLREETALKLFYKLEDDPAFIYRLMLLGFSSFQVEE